MQHKKNKKGTNAKNSNISPYMVKMSKLLDKVYNMGGIVSYVFIQERIRFTKDKPEGETYLIKAMQHSDINPQVFYKNEHGVSSRRTTQEILDVFNDIKSDIGANYYIID